MFACSNWKFGAAFWSIGLYALLCLLCYAGHQSSCDKKFMVESAVGMMAAGEIMKLFSGFSGFKDPHGKAGDNGKPVDNEAHASTTI
jgi:hypothetical protein